MDHARRLALRPADQLGFWSLYEEDPDAWGGQTRGGRDLGVVFGSWATVCEHVRGLRSAEYIDVQPWSPPDIKNLQTRQGELLWEWVGLIHRQLARALDKEKPV